MNISPFILLIVMVGTVAVSQLIAAFIFFVVWGGKK